MPCKDGREDDWERERSTELSNSKKRVTYLEACLCAIINEIPKEERTETLKTASSKGDVDVISFWEEHLEEDKSRLETEVNNFVNKFSEHEKLLLTEIFSKKNLEIKK